MIRYGFCALVLLFSTMIGNQAKATCWNEAGAKYGIDPLLLMAIGWKESRGNPNAVGPPLKDGNVALGLMQINTIHLPNLRRYGITRNDLFSPCISVHVGASVLRDCINQYNEIWRAVGCYYGGKNSKAYNAMSEYSRDVQKYYASYVKMFRPQIPHNSASQPVTGVSYAPQIINQNKVDISKLELVLFSD